MKAIRYIPILLLILTLLSCAPLGGTTPGLSAATAASIPGSSSATTQPGGQAPGVPATPVTSQSSAPAPNSALDLSTMGSLESLQSYVLTTSYHVEKIAQAGTPPGERSGNSTVSVIHSPMQAAYTITNIQTGAVGMKDYNSQSFTYWVGDMAYTFAPDAGYWFVSPRGQNGNDNDYYYLNSISVILEGFKPTYAGEQDYQGIPAWHYSIDQTSTFPARGGKTTIIYTGDLYLAKDGNFPLHLAYRVSGDAWWENVPGTAVGEGNDSTRINVPGTGEYIYDVTSINAVSSVQIPPNVPVQVNLQNDVPLPPGAKFTTARFPDGNYSTIAFSYVVNLSDDQILSFYHDLQPVNGWSVNTVAKDPDGSGGLITLEGPNGFLTLNISYDEFRQANEIYFSLTTP